MCDGYLNLKALASYSGFSVRWLRQRLIDPINPLPHFRAGGKITVRQSEFDGWVERFRVKPPTNLNAIVDEVLASL